MKEFLLLVLFVIIAFSIGLYFESKKDPYEVGMHFDYKIECENGFVYKFKRGMTMQVFNSDGTPLRCGEKIK